MRKISAASQKNSCSGSSRNSKGRPAATLPRLTYKEAMETYGSDKPDTRFGLKFTCVNDFVKDSGFRVFADVAKKGGVVAGFIVPARRG